MVEAGSVSATDVFVIGGGPAGIAAGLAARQQGLDVIVADGCAPPIDKPCGEGLMPDGVDALQKLGVEIRLRQAHAFRGIRFVSGGLAVQACFPYGEGFGIRRTVLHHRMVEQAQKAGVRFYWGSTVSGLHPHGVIANGNLVRARWIIGADGSGSRVRRWADLDVHRKMEQRFAFRRHYRLKPWSDFMELHWGRKCQLYVTPVSSEEVCVALISRDPKLRLDDAIPQFPEVAKRLHLVSHGSLERGAVSVTRRLARVCNDRIALIGDASGGVDAITGEGLCLAFRQADLLGESLSSGSLALYGSAHQSLVRRPALMARLMLMLEHRAWLRLRVMRAFVSQPKLFAGLLAAHVGAVVAADVFVNGLSLGWNLFSA